MSEFDFSEDHIKKTHRIILIVVIPLTVVFAVVFSLILSDFDVKEASIVACGALLLSGTCLVIGTRRANRSLRRMRVLSDEDKIVKQCGKSQQLISWDNIIKVKVIENPKGDVEKIRLYTKDKREMWLAGFEEMKGIASLIKKKISRNILIETKRSKFDWGSPIFVAIVFIGWMFFLCLIASIGIEAIEMFMILFILGTGTWSLIYRPLTKFNLSDKWFEITSSVLLIFCGISLFVILVLKGKFLY